MPLVLLFGILGAKFSYAQEAEPLAVGQLAYSIDNLILFIARRSHKMYPVYTYGDKVFATTPGDPVFEHVELAIALKNYGSVRPKIWFGAA
jgi:hypothetical protein